MDERLDLSDALDLLSRGEIKMAAQFGWGSNFSYLVDVSLEGRTAPAVYKPSRGERPLWDFPEGTLAVREVAAYVTSEALGWGLVPATVLRGDGPAGGGSLQAYVEADPEAHYFTLSEEERQELRPVAVFDLLVNNADRKAGHVLRAGDGGTWLIDHGLCFHHLFKLRTVIWEFAEEPIPKPLLKDVAAFRRQLEDDAGLCATYRDLLAPREVEALKRRADRILQVKRFPSPGPGRPYPWPLV